LQTWSPVIPETGGWLSYGAQVSNILLDPTPLDAWIVITGPNGSRTALNNFPVTLQPGSTFTEPQINVHVPAAAPDGEYVYEVLLGDTDSHGSMGLGSFTFTKGAVSADDPDEPNTYGDLIPGASPGPPWPQLSDSRHPFTGQPFDMSPGDGSSRLASKSGQTLPATFEMCGAYPNPFNSMTAVTVTLPQPSDLTVTVFNALGQEIVQLANGRTAAGTHTLTFDASNLASGLYFIHANVPGKLSTTQKVMLVR
jgi:hypothetical protein